MERQAKILIALTVVLVCFIAADFLSTHIALNIPGIVEGNPTSKDIIDKYGMIGLGFNTLLLVASSFVLPIVYLLVSRKLDKLPRKSPKDEKWFFILDWGLFIVCFVILLISTMIRSWVVANNIYLIITCS